MNKFKDKYQIDWCDLCKTAIIQCQFCGNSSCNGGGCDKCHEDFEEFIKKDKSEFTKEWVVNNGGKVFDDELKDIFEKDDKST